jgi:predicted Zn-dependent protease with MMP-like domain
MFESKRLPNILRRFVAVSSADAMNHEEFEGVVRDVMAGLPDWVHAALDNIDVLVVDEADEDLDPDGEGYLGLYLGLPLPERGADYAGELPDVIYIFRLPHLSLCLSEIELREEIAKTLIHEIAHYFGFDDDELDERGFS